MFKTAMVVFFKEMKDLLRDKKTFIMGLLIPLTLLPVMLFIIDYSMNSSQRRADDEIRIAVSSKDNSFYKFCTAHDDIKVVDVDNTKAAMESGIISAYIKVSENIDKDKDYTQDLDIQFNTSSIGSMMSTRKIAYYRDLYFILAQSLKKHVSSAEELRNMISNADINGAVMKEYPYTDDDGAANIDMSSMYFNMLVPMMLILYCCVGSSSTASDLSAGEKERGTLEALLSTGADRTSIIVGKLLATTAMGAMSGLCTVLGLSVYLIVSSGTSSFSLTFFEFLALLIITLFTSMFFAAVNLTIGVYSKSSKEAQTYLMPVSVISLIPTYFTYTLDVGSINIEYLCIPIVNIVCVIKEIFAGSLNPLHIGIVVGWLLLYVAAAFSLTSYMFKKESVVFRN